MTPRSRISWQVVTLSVSCLTLGVAAGVIGSGAYYLSSVNTMAQDLYRKTSRVQLLESLVFHPSSALLGGALDREAGLATGLPGVEEPKPVPNKPTEVALAPSPSTNALRATHGPVVRSRGAASAPSSDTNAPRAVPGPAVGSRVALAPSPAVATKVSGEEVLDAMRNRIEGVSADKAGVVRVDRDAVLLRNGTAIRVGESFPSGERLLLIDHENARVVTNQRQMLLFFSR